MNIYKMSDDHITKLFNRIFSNQRDIKLLIEPYSRLKNKTNNYGSLIRINTIEVKYKNSKCNSNIMSINTNFNSDIINITIWL